MAVKVWDAITQVFKDAETPKIWDAENQAWKDSTGLIWDPSAGAWKEVWSPFPDIPDKVYLLTRGTANYEVTGGFQYGPYSGITDRGNGLGYALKVHSQQCGQTSCAYTKNPIKVPKGYRLCVQICSYYVSDTGVINGATGFQAGFSNTPDQKGFDILLFNDFTTGTTRPTYNKANLRSSIALTKNINMHCKVCVDGGGSHYLNQKVEISDIWIEKVS